MVLKTLSADELNEVFQNVFFFSIFTDRIPARLNIGLMLFSACFISYMLRVNMSINILAMVKSKPSINETETTPIEHDVSNA